MKTTDSSRTFAVAILLIGFLLGGAVGFFWKDSKQSQETEKRNSAPANPIPLGTASDEISTQIRDRRPTQRREPRPTLRLDEEGNLLVPAALEDRIQCSLMTDSEVNRDHLAFFGLTDDQIDCIQRLVMRTLQQCSDREKAVAREYTRNDDEVVLRIPGSASTAKTLKQQTADAIREVAANQATFVEKRLVADLSWKTMGFGENDYFLRVSRLEPGNMLFQSIRFFNGREPAPGDTFAGFEKRYIFDSSRNYVAPIPPHYTAHLLRQEDYAHLLNSKP